MCDRAGFFGKNHHWAKSYPPNLPQFKISSFIIKGIEGLQYSSTEIFHHFYNRFSDICKLSTQSLSNMKYELCSWSKLLCMLQ